MKNKHPSLHIALTIVFIFLFSLTGFSQKEKKVKTVVIKTTIYCDHCKVCESCGGRILKQLYNEEGIKNTSVDSKANTITVVYDTRKTDIEKIKVMISKMGFDADDIKADPVAVGKLDDCCKKE